MEFGPLDGREYDFGPGSHLEDDSHWLEQMLELRSGYLPEKIDLEKVVKDQDLSAEERTPRYRLFETEEP